MNRYQGLEPGALFEMATAEFEDGDHGTAITVLDRLLVGHGDWERIPEARMLLGDVYFDRGDYLTARSEYTRFLDRYAGHPSSVQASLSSQSSEAGTPSPSSSTTPSSGAVETTRTRSLPPHADKVRATMSRWKGRIISLRASCRADIIA